jgi:hypothetical protein
LADRNNFVFGTEVESSPEYFGEMLQFWHVGAAEPGV